VSPRRSAWRTRQRGARSAVELSVLGGRAGARIDGPYRWDRLHQDAAELAFLVGCAGASSQVGSLGRPIDRPARRLRAESSTAELLRLPLSRVFQWFGWRRTSRIAANELCLLPDASAS
jgi:hypothetical protein